MLRASRVLRLNPFVAAMALQNLGAAAWYAREALWAKALYFLIGSVSLVLVEAM